MRTVTKEIYTFDELSEDAKQKAIDASRYWNVEGFEWWDYTFEDAKRVGLKITSFDLDRHRHAEGTLTMDVGESVQAIMDEHGPDCGTVELAREYYRRKHIGHPMDVDEYTGLLLEEYSIMLQEASEYLASDEAVADSLSANEVEFYKDGSSL